MMVPACQIISRRTPESHNFGTNKFYNFETLVDTEIIIIAWQKSRSALLN